MSEKVFVDLFEDDLRPMQYWHDRLSEQLANWKTGKAEGYTTGFDAIDSLTRLYPSEMMLIAARPSMGKTQLAVQLAANVARSLVGDADPGCVALFSAEMSGTSVYARMATMECGIASSKLRNGEGTQQEYANFEDAMMRVRRLPLWMDDASGPSTNYMLERLEELHATNPVRMMVFDFVELARDAGGSKEERVSKIAEHLKAIAKKLQIPVLVLSQLNREVEARSNKMPQLSDLRGSGMLEQLADQVLFIMRPEYYIERGQSVTDLHAETDRQGVAYVIVAKNRNGEVGSRKLAWVKERAMFADLERTELNA